MTVLVGAAGPPRDRAEPRGGPRVVVCGSFRRDPERLREDFTALLSAGASVLSPLDVSWVDDVDGFVLAAHEVDEDPTAIQARHLAALQTADMVWLHAPGGYIGPSAALELGVAHALGIPVFARELPADITLRHFAIAIGTPDEAISRRKGEGGHTPSRPLGVLQDYYRRIADARGYHDESPQDTMLLLTEEVGELARAVRKVVGLSRSGGYDQGSAADELADVQLYLLHLANVMGVGLAEAVAEKERVNATRAALAEQVAA